jgi:hypothetical protein
MSVEIMAVPNRCSRFDEVLMVYRLQMFANVCNGRSSRDGLDVLRYVQMLGGSFQLYSLKQIIMLMSIPTGTILNFDFTSV